MQITPDEIAAVEEAGMLDQSPVKLIRTKGGFWIAVGKPKGKMGEIALAAGSHPAIVKYNLAKQYPGFQEHMMKSADMAENDAIVDKHSHFLSEDLRKSGHDIYSVQKGPDISFHITRHQTQVGRVVGHLQDDSIVIDSMAAATEFARAIAGAAAEKAVSVGAKDVRIGVK